MSPFLLTLMIVSVSAVDHQQSFNCPENQDCFLVCDDNNPCIDIIINCPINFLCNINCQSTSCNNSTVNASSSSSLQIHTKQLWTSGMTIYLPPSSSNIPNTHIYDEKSTNALQHTRLLQLYAINGFNDINIHHTNIHPLDYDKSHGIMHCTSNYTSHCEFSSISSSCIDHENICNGLSISTQSDSRLNHQRRLLAGETIIRTGSTGTWNDNAYNNSLAPPNPGWTVTVNPNGQSRVTETTDTAIVSGTFWFHGPYDGRPGSNVREYTIAQSFYCSERSFVTIGYCAAGCGLTDQSIDTYVELYLDDTLQSDGILTARDVYSGDKFSSANLSAQAESCSSAPIWDYTCISSIGGIIVQGMVLFEVKFFMNVDAKDEYMALAGITVTCNLATESPTTSEPTTATPTTSYPTTSYPTTSIPTTFNPTTSFPSTTSATTLDPTTAEPSITPSAADATSEPTTAIPTTAEPSSIQSVSPTTADPTTTIPTCDPTGTCEPTFALTTNTPSTQMPSISPSESPSKEPTKQPTYDPTSEPSNKPTTSRPTTPSESPTANPSTEPTIEPTVQPTVEPTKDCKDWKIEISFKLLRYTQSNNWRNVLKRLCLQAFEESVIYLSLKSWKDDWCVNLEITFSTSANRRLLQDTSDIDIDSSLIMNELLYNDYFNSFNSTKFKIEFQSIFNDLIGTDHDIEDLVVGEPINIDTNTITKAPKPTYAPNEVQSATEDTGKRASIIAVSVTFGLCCCVIVFFACRLFVKHEADYEKKYEASQQPAMHMQVQSDTFATMELERVNTPRAVNNEEDKPNMEGAGDGIDSDGFTVPSKLIEEETLHTDSDQDVIDDDMGKHIQTPQ